MIRELSASLRVATGDAASKSIGDFVNFELAILVKLTIMCQRPSFSTTLALRNALRRDISTTNVTLLGGLAAGTLAVTRGRSLSSDAGRSGELAHELGCTFFRYSARAIIRRSQLRVDNNLNHVSRATHLSCASRIISSKHFRRFSSGLRYVSSRSPSPLTNLLHNPQAEQLKIGLRAFYDSICILRRIGELDIRRMRAKQGKS